MSSGGVIVVVFNSGDAASRVAKLSAPRHVGRYFYLYSGAPCWRRSCYSSVLILIMLIIAPSSLAIDDNQ